MSKSSQLCSHGRLTTAFCEPCAEIDACVAIANRYEPVPLDFSDLWGENKRLREENKRLIRACESISKTCTQMLDPIRRAGPVSKM